MDFFLRPDRANANRVLRALRDFGLGSLELTEDAFTTPEQVVQLGRPPNPIDLLTTLAGVDFEAAWEGKEQALMDDLQVPIIGRLDLIKNKQSLGRLKELADVEALEAVAKAKD